MAPDLEIQGAVVARLKAVVPAVSGRVYDHIPPGADFPRIKFGQSDIQRDDSQCHEGRNIVFVVHVHSRAVGAPEARAIAFHVEQALHRWSPALATNMITEIRHLNTLTVPEAEDGLTTHSVLRFRAQTFAA